MCRNIKLFLFSFAPSAPQIHRVSGDSERICSTQRPLFSLLVVLCVLVFRGIAKFFKKEKVKAFGQPVSGLCRVVSNLSLIYVICGFLPYLEEVHTKRSNFIQFSGGSTGRSICVKWSLAYGRRILRVVL